MDVNVGRLRTTTSGKRDVMASSGRSIGSVAKELGLRDSVLRRWVEQRGAGASPGIGKQRIDGRPIFLDTSYSRSTPSTVERSV
jgi:transposase-like protein